jgi:uncharacterized protein YutE (UPF0331/DUF86 family)
MDNLLDTINHLIKDNGYTPEQLITILADNCIQKKQEFTLTINIEEVNSIRATINISSIRERVNQIKKNDSIM